MARFPAGKKLTKMMLSADVQIYGYNDEVYFSGKPVIYLNQYKIKLYQMPNFGHYSLQK